MLLVNWLHRCVDRIRRNSARRWGKHAPRHRSQFFRQASEVGSLAEVLEDRTLLTVLDLSEHAAGNDNVADTITVSLDANDSTRLHVHVNEQLALSESLSNLGILIINGSNDSDTLVVDSAYGLPSLQINYNAGQGVVDALEMLGLPAGANAKYATLPPTQDGKSGINTVTAGDSTLEVHFTGIEPQTFVGAGGTLTLDATSTPATSMLTLSDVGVFNDGVNRVTGDGGFEDTTFSGFDSLVVLGGDGAETITFEGLDDADPDGGGPGVALTNVTLDGDNTGGTDTAADTINLQAMAASMTVTIRGGAGSDTITLGTIANSISGLLGNIMIDGEGHDAGSTTLTISIGSNTLDTGDILNLNDQNDAGNFTYTLDATTFTRSGLGTITYNNIETFNLNTSLGFGGPTTVNVNNTAASVNTNITTQNVTGQPSDINVTTTGADSNVIINTSTANDDVNLANVGGDGPDGGFLSSFTRINTSGGNDIFTQQNAPQNAFIEVNLDAGTDTANVHSAGNAALTDINAGDNTDTLNWGNPSNTLTGYAGILQFDGGNHDAGSSSLTIKGETNTLDSGDIVNLNDQGETADTGYQFQEFGSSILAREGAGGLTYTNTETFNVNTTSGVAAFIGFGSAPGININYNSQDSADTFLFFDGEGIGDDVNFVINSAGGADSFDIDETGGNGTAGNATFGAFVQINAGDDNDTFTIDDVAAGDRFELNGEAGDDTFNVTPSLGVINVLGGTPAAPSMPGDTLNFTQPGGETSTLVNQTADSGTYQTTGGFADVCYDEIESGPPPFSPDDTEVTLSGTTLTITDVDGGNSNDQLDVSFAAGTYTITDTGGLTIDASSVAGSTGSGTSTVTVPQGTIDTLTVNTLAGVDSIRVQQVPAGTTANINGGDNTDTINLGTAGNSLGGLLGDINVNGDAHDAGTTTLMISVLSNTLDTGDILNLNDQNDAGAFTYTVDATTFTRNGGVGTVTYGTIETLNLNTSASGGGPTDVDVVNTAAGINTNITTQSTGGTASDIDITNTGVDSNTIITTSTGNDDINIASVGADGPDGGPLVGSLTTITTGAGNDVFTQQNAGFNSGIEVNLEAGTDTANIHAAQNAALTDINAGDNTDTLNWGNPSNTLTGYAGILQFDGGNHDAGSSSLTIKGETNTLDSGDIVNLNDQGETAETGYQFQEFGSSILAREGAGGLTYTNTETFNVNTTSGVANFIGFGSAPGININYTSQDSADTFLFFDGEGIGDDVNLVINSAGGADDFDIDETGGNGTAGNATFGAFVQINAGNDNDTFTIDDVAANDRIELRGDAGDDTFNVTPSLGVINVVGGNPAAPASPGDTLNFTQPAGETSTLVNQTPDSGTYQTTGGFADVCYDEIESGPPPIPAETEITLVGGTLTVVDVNGGTSDDNLVVFLLGTDYQFTDNGGLIIDASSIPGSTGSGTNMVTVPAAGVTGLDVRTLGGDDMLLWLDVAARDYSVGGISIDGGTGEDTMSYSASMPVNMGNADLTVTATKTASVSGAGPFSFVDGNLTVEGNASGTFAGSTAGTAAALGATVNISGTGSVSVTGRGGTMGGAGVLFQGRVTNSATGPTAGTITLDGQAGGSTAGSPGVTMTNPNAFITSVDGDIMITGVGTSGGDDNYGIEINDIDRIESTGTGADAATITLHGTAGGGAFDNAGLRIFSGDITSALGDIMLTGIGGTADPTSFASAGVSVLRSTIQINAGNLQIDGTSNGGIAAGVWMLMGEILSIGSGTVEITATANALGPDMKSENINNVIGGASSASPFTINANSIDWANLTVQSTGDLVIQPRTAGTTIGLGGGMGDLNLDDTELGFLVDGFNSITIGDTAAGSGTVDIDSVTFTDPITIAGGTIHDGAGADIAAGTNSVTLDGNVSPGQSPGILTVTGNFAFATGATYEAEIFGAIPGVLHDQIDVTGTVDINNATLNIDDTGFTASGNESIVIINNDGADAVTGTFNGLAEGATLTVGTRTFSISYVGGDGNDVVLTAAPTETEITLVGGTLTVVDVNGGTSDDNLVVFLLGTDYQFTDNGGLIIDASSIPGSTGSGTNMVTVPAAGVTGLDVRTLGGDDMLLWLDVAARDYSVGGISIDGGTGEDTMSYSASMPVNMGNADLTVTATKTASVSGAGPFSFVDGNLTVEGNASGTFAGSTAGTAAALGATVNISGTGSVSVTGRGGTMGGAGVLFQGRVTNSATGPTAGTITLDGQAGGSTAGSPGVTMTNPNAFITSVDGDIMITGVGTSGGDDNYGIEINDIDRIESTGTGADAATITLHGTAGGGAFDNAGLRIFSGDITSALGDIMLTGIGGTADPTSFASAGVSVLRSTIQINAGNLQIDGTSNGGIAAGVWMLMGEILSIGSGTVEITATANALGPDMKSENINNVIGGASSASPFTINANSIDWANLTVQSTGDLVIQPRTAGTTIGLGGGMGDLNLDDTELGFLVDGFNSITIGDTAAGSGTVDIDSVTFTDPITIAGGTIHDGAGADIAAGTNSVTLDGNVSPGQSPGILTVTGNFAFATGATYEAEIFGSIPGVLHDRIDVTGTVDINNATLNVDSTGFTAAGSEIFVLINNDAADAVTGTFNGLPQGSLVTVGGVMFVLNYAGGDGNDVVLQTQPDFGDAPAPYPVTLAEGGAQHNDPGLSLGAIRDGEADGVHSAAADADGADEDGVTFGALQVGALDATVTVNVQGAPGRLDAWIDFNRDGVWGGPGEQIFDSVNVALGNNNLMFDVPATALDDTTYARFRLSTAGGLGVGGAAADGEVEDYQVTIVSPAVSSGTVQGQRLIDNLADGAQSVFAVDMDGDGDMDVIGAASISDEVLWYENDGSENFTKHVISTAADLVNDVYAADVDGDGDIDVLSASFDGNEIAWYENDGAQNFTKHVISNTATGTRKVITADMDGDGDIDVLSSSEADDTIEWYENDGAQNFTEHTISVAVDAPRGVFPADVDGDGDMDVLATSQFDDKILWYENDGNQNFTEILIDNTTNQPIDVFGADIDGDGDMDIASVSLADDRVAWFENDGNENFTLNTISQGPTNGPIDVVVADTDGDGDQDLLAASLFDNTITLYRNDGAQNFTPQTVTNSAAFVFVILAADVDGDNDLDVLSASRNDDTIAWYKNQPIPEDWGDAPTAVLAGGGTFVNDYPVTEADDGARHMPVGPTLGPNRDIEFEGVPSVMADSDDNDVAPDDEDGVTFPGGPTLTVSNAVGLTGSVDIDLQNADAASNRLDAWVDWNRDGDWQDPGEQVLADFDLGTANGVQTVNFPIPQDTGANVELGDSYARFRLSTAGGLGTSGGAADGEVEDYRVTITVDITAPVVTVNPTTTTDITPGLGGMVDDPTAAVSVSVDGNTYPAVNNGDGTWTLADNTITPALATGIHPVTVTATDPAQNVGTDATTNELSVAIFAFDFGAAGSPVEAGFDQVLTSTVLPATPLPGDFGWVDNTGIQDRDRTTVASDLQRDYHKTNNPSVTFSALLANGDYDVTFIIGSGQDPRTNVGVLLEGTQVATVTTTPGQFETQTHTVTVADGRLDLELARQGPTSSGINGLIILPTSTEPKLDATDATGFYRSGDPPLAIDPGLLVTDANDPNLIGATVSIIGGFSMADDTLAFVDQLGITGGYNATSGILTLSGTATVADYQAALRSVTFSSTATTAGTRIIEFGASDGTGTGFDSRSLTLVPPAGANQGFDFNDTGSPTEPGFTPVEVDDLFSDPVGFGWLMDAVTNGISARDRGAPDALRQDYHKVGAGSMTFAVNLPAGTYDVTVTLGSNIDARNGVGVFLENTQVDTVATAAGVFDTKTHRVTVSDGRLEVKIEKQGSTGISINSLQIVEITGAPTVDLADVPAIFQNGSGPIFIDAALTVDDIDSPNLTGATVSLTAGHNAAADMLLFVDQLGITGNFVGATGVLTLTGTASVADYQTALRSVQFDSTDMTGLRTVQVVVDDGTDTGMDTRDINVTGPFTAASYDFGTPTSPIEPGFIGVNETTAFTVAQGYGWQSTTGVGSRERTGPLPLDERHDYARIGVGSMTFLVTVPNGNYDVTVTVGSFADPRNNVGILLEGTQVTTITQAPMTFAVETHMVSVSDNLLEVTVERQGTTAAGINALVVTKLP